MMSNQPIRRKKGVVEFCNIMNGVGFVDEINTKKAYNNCSFLSRAKPRGLRDPIKSKIKLVHTAHCVQK